MNWTGGRLQRHSRNIHGTLARNQKQKFAKSRLQSTRKAQNASFVGDFAIFGSLNQSQQKEDGEVRHELAKSPATLSRSQPARDPPNLPDQTNTSQLPDRLEQIKRRLLEKADWAAVGAARPLKISFTPVEEVEQFGKRRKLTESDRARLTSPNRRILRPEPGRSCKKPHQNVSSDIPGIEGLEIRINGQRCHAGGLATTCKRYQDASSQPMLLDRDEYVFPDQAIPSVPLYALPVIMSLTALQQTRSHCLDGSRSQGAVFNDR
ncbi:uncharacterized protein ACLA_041300 [Aspergillus clavatus NRRL 1]|uniref:Uncharacterized protein n=1 Tax=Aspergillus clavatus (strain ATCC 1007 / CBS 513.65 / DSM 816 / NCTC 3887 / NRRL 1 / QM 1276 / 107) TaxID=344612 RepID=A1CL88_ASPCL|nr:uncharacterized protein ACLA_041300 [Aspergillus clavatus NRRL 1]EAW09912.1 hypothetical protein ACLA_041300 [Aspergillus clavatus NRRL 1]